MASLLAAPNVARPSISTHNPPNKPGKSLERTKVKFYKLDAGWGFLTRPNKRDAFIHAEILKNAGLERITPGQELLACVEETNTSCRATVIRLP
jgi:cold shock CspA family protein